jgi:nucleoside-diphosphate-sugar epimerase
MTKILVTGRAGFLGSATIAELQKHGHDIYVIDCLLLGEIII